MWKFIVMELDSNFDIGKIQVGESSSEHTPTIIINFYHHYNNSICRL